MSKIKIEGGHKLTGKIEISGAKNSAVALVPAAILCDEEVTISNVPNISDIDALIEILEFAKNKQIKFRYSRSHNRRRDFKFII